MTTNGEPMPTDPRAYVLRAAGHTETEAATLLEQLDGLNAKPAPETEATPEPAPATRFATPWEAADAERRAEGEAMLAGLRHAGILPADDAA